jgi:hypothetical protein
VNPLSNYHQLLQAKMAWLRERAHAQLPKMSDVTDHDRRESIKGLLGLEFGETEPWICFWMARDGSACLLSANLSDAALEHIIKQLGSEENLAKLRS